MGAGSSAVEKKLKIYTSRSLLVLYLLYYSCLACGQPSCGCTYTLSFLSFSVLHTLSVKHTEIIVRAESAGISYANLQDTFLDMFFIEWALINKMYWTKEKESIKYPAIIKIRIHKFKNSLQSTLDILKLFLNFVQTIKRMSTIFVGALRSTSLMDVTA